MYFLIDQWRIIQQRIDESTDFYLFWDDYKRGFGNNGTNYWMGLDGMHHLTSPCPSPIRIRMMSYDWGELTEYYRKFSVGNASSYYKLNISGFVGRTNDRMGRTNGAPFSTRDVDHDEYHNFNCAEQYQGAWWYTRCTNVNPNGVMGINSNSQKASAFWQYGDREWNRRALKSITMDIIPIDTC